MKKLLRRLVILGAVAGAFFALRGYLDRESPGEEAVQIVFGDGSMRVFDSNSREGQEFTDIARSLIEIGV